MKKRKPKHIISKMALKLESHIERVLWDQHQISRRVSELASQISADFGGAANSDSPPPPPPVLVGVATGAFLFLADLVRNIDLPISVDFVRADSYGSGTISAGAPKLSLDLKVDVKGKHVILVLSLSLIGCLTFSITYQTKVFIASMLCSLVCTVLLLFWFLKVTGCFYIGPLRFLIFILVHHV